MQIKRHVKCDGGGTRGPCSRCVERGDRCTRTKSFEVRFRSSSAAQQNALFVKDQKWLKTSGKKFKLSFVDETAEVSASYLDLSDENSQASQEESNTLSQTDEPPAYITPESITAHDSFINKSVRVKSSSKKNKASESARAVEHERVKKLRRRNSRYNPLEISASTPGSGSETPSHTLHRRFSHSNRDRSSSSASALDIAALLGSQEHLIQPTPTGTGTIISRSSSQDGAQNTLYLPESIAEPLVTHDADAELFMQAVLMRYFKQEFTLWFDLCDPEYHFATVVPQRARFSRPLLYAVLTASARHLVRLSHQKFPGTIIYWQGDALPLLSKDTIVHYHNQGIRDLLQSSMDPRQLQNEDLLAAAIILRTDEEMNDSIFEKEEDQQIFLKVINAFVNAQVPAAAKVPHSSPHVYFPDTPADLSIYPDPAHALPASLELQRTQANSPNEYPVGSMFESSPANSAVTPRTIRSDGLRQACFWVALRQEVLGSYLQQRPISFPLSRCSSFRGLTPAEDAVWADRMIIFCADVLQYCYGGYDSGEEQPASPSVVRWHELRDHDKILSQNLPTSFEPMYSREIGKEDVFPELWYLDPSHVTGHMHMELARILLLVFDPTRPRLGPGYVASMKTLEANLRSIVLRLCGIALSNPRSPPNFINACVGIAMCGEYFHNPKEQEALLRVLSMMETSHAYPTAKIADDLRRAWKV